jgi:hypothetical protein
MLQDVESENGVERLRSEKGGVVDVTADLRARAFVDVDGQERLGQRQTVAVAVRGNTPDLECVPDHRLA